MLVCNEVAIAIAPGSVIKLVPIFNSVRLLLTSSAFAISEAPVSLILLFSTIAL